MLALVTDAFGGHGGIAQYNRDLLSATISSGAVSTIQILPRHAPAHPLLPAGIEAINPEAWSYRLRYGGCEGSSLRPINRRRFLRPSLYGAVGRVDRASRRIQADRADAWDRSLAAPDPASAAAVEAADLVLCVSRYTRARVLMGGDRARTGHRAAQYGRRGLHAGRWLALRRHGDSKASACS